MRILSNIASSLTKVFNAMTLERPILVLKNDRDIAIIFQCMKAQRVKFYKFIQFKTLVTCL